MSDTVPICRWQSDLDPCPMRSAYDNLNNAYECLKKEFDLLCKERDEWHGRFCRVDAHRDELKSELAAALEENVRFKAQMFNVDSLHDKAERELRDELSALKADLRQTAGYELGRRAVEITENALHETQKQLTEARAEIAEQCRLNAMGQERELKLLAEIESLKDHLADRQCKIISRDALLEKCEKAIKQLDPSQPTLVLMIKKEMLAELRARR